MLIKEVKELYPAQNAKLKQKTKSPMDLRNRTVGRPPYYLTYILSDIMKIL